MSDHSKTIDGLLASVRSYVARSFEPLRDRIKAIEDRAPVAGRDGRDGVDGKDVDPAAVAQLVIDGVKRVAESLPKPLDGKDGAAGTDGKDGAPGAAGNDADEAAIAARVQETLLKVLDKIPPAQNGKDGAPGRDGVDGAPGERGEKGEPGERGADGATGKDGAPGVQGDKGLDGKDGAPGINGTDGAPGKPGNDGASGIDGQDGARGGPGERGEPGEKGLDGAPGEKGLDGRDGRDGQEGAPGRDALQLDVLDGIDTAKRYQRGTFAAFRGGLIRSYRQTDPVDEGVDLAKAGWQVILDGDAEESEDWLDERTIVNIKVKTSGRQVKSTRKMAVLIDRGTFKSGQVSERGDVLTYGGSLFIAQRSTLPTEKPEDGSGAFRLAVKRGRDGGSS